MPQTKWAFFSTTDDQKRPLVFDETKCLNRFTKKKRQIQSQLNLNLKCLELSEEQLWFELKPKGSREEGKDDWALRMLILKDISAFAPNNTSATVLFTAM